MRLETLRDLVEGLPSRGRRPAVGERSSYGERWWSYRRLHRAAHRAARVLGEHGVGAGEPVVLLAANGPELAAFLLGCALRGAVAVPVDAEASTALVSRIVERTSARAVVCSSRREREDRLDEVWIDLEGASAEDDAVQDRAPLPESGPRGPRPEDPAVVLFTSGSSGEPTGVVLTHANIVSQLRRFRWLRRLTRPFRVRMLCLSPLSHSQGLVIGLYLPLFAGYGALYTLDLSPVHLLRTLRKSRVRVLLAVPRLQHLLIDALLRQPCGPDRTLGERLAEGGPWWRQRHRVFKTRRRTIGLRLRWVISGGARLSPRDERFWFLARCFLLQGYGLTESSALVSLQVNTPFRYSPGSIGRPLRGQSWRIADDGELLVSGSHVARSALESGAASTAGSLGLRAMPEELATGDLVERRGRRLYLVGRKKETIVTAEGQNVHPGKIEEALEACEEVAAAVVLPRTRSGQEEVHAVLIPTAAASAGRVVQRVNAALEPWQRIAGWSLWPEDDFPRVRLGKVDRATVAARLRSGLDPASATPGSEDDKELAEILEVSERGERIRALARRLVADPAPAPGAGSRNGEDDLRVVDDLGMSSLDLLELTAELERQAAVSLEELVTTRGTTLGELRRLVSATAPERPSFRRSAVAPPSEDASPRPAEAATPPPQAPRQLGIVARVARRLVAPLYFRLAVALRARLEVEGRRPLEQLEGPFFLFAQATTEMNRIHLAACRQALPGRCRRKLLWVTAPEHLFKPFLDPEGSYSAAERTLSKWFYRLCPGFLAFSFWPHFGTLRRGLVETCDAVARGYCPLVLRVSTEALPEAPLGVLTVARETGIPVVPMRIEGHERVGAGLSRRQPWRVSFGRPIPVPRHGLDAEVQEAIAAELAALEGPG